MLLRQKPLAKQKHFTNRAQVRVINHSYVRKVTFLFLCFLSQNVTFVSVFTLYFTCSGKSESFFGTGISFYLWHFSLLFRCLYYRVQAGNSLTLRCFSFNSIH